MANAILNFHFDFLNTSLRERNNHCRVFATSNDVLNKRRYSQFNSNGFSKHLVFSFMGKTFGCFLKNCQNGSTWINYRKSFIQVWAPNSFGVFRALNKRGCSQFNSNEFSKHLVFSFIGKTFGCFLKNGQYWIIWINYRRSFVQV